MMRAPALDRRARACARARRGVRRCSASGSWSARVESRQPWWMRRHRDRAAARQRGEAGAADHRQRRRVSWSRSTGSFVPGDFTSCCSDRLNDGTTGYWVVGARDRRRRRGRAPSRCASGGRSRLGRRREDRDGRRSSDWPTQAREPQTIVGRLPADRGARGPEDTTSSPASMTTLAVAALINLWTGWTARRLRRPTSSTATPHAGLELIDSPPPIAGEHAQLAQPLLRGRVGRLRRLRDLPLVPPGEGRLGARRRTS